MITNKMIEKSEILFSKRKIKWVDKLKELETYSPEEMVQALSNGLFKAILFLGIPYFLFVFIQFLLK